MVNNRDSETSEASGVSVDLTNKTNNRIHLDHSMNSRQSSDREQRRCEERDNKNMSNKTKDNNSRNREMGIHIIEISMAESTTSLKAVHKISLNNSLKSNKMHLRIKPGISRINLNTIKTLIAAHNSTKGIIMMTFLHKEIIGILSGTVVRNLRVNLNSGKKIK